MTNPAGSRICRRLFGLFAIAQLAVSVSRAEDPLPSAERLKTSPVLRHLKPNPTSAKPAAPAEETIAQMHVPEGFRVELIKAEPDVQQPVAFAFDERGRLWVAEAYSYPTKRPDGQGQDKIVIFEDKDGDGKFETRKVFAEGLNLVSGFELGYGGVWVGAAPQLLFIPDRNHDDIPDGPPEVLLDGFGFQDTHECLNSFMWGPDGWLYGNQGVFNYARIGKPGAPDSQRTELRAGVWRYHPVRHQFEVFAHGGSNPWGLDYDEQGQIFMTHCRSYWGRGCTTHVIQGGHFWNQANANYAPFIIANPPDEFPGYRNFLLASARYDHGAGGAGAPGSDAIYGGHSHVGTMIYLGDNWPDEYRGHLFTHNLGGHQMNHQINKPLGSGFETVDANRDQLFCTDPRYVAVDLQYGPDGAVYMIDWYDQQHCHNPNTESWDRSTGRIYRMEYESTYHPKKVDLGKMDDLQLARLQNEKNEWYSRMARKLLHERALEHRISRAARQHLADMCAHDPVPARRLRALWTLHEIGALSAGDLARELKDSDEYVRGWTVQLALDGGKVDNGILHQMASLAQVDPSPVVRRFLASAIARLPEREAWEVVSALVSHGEDRADRNLPLLIWDGLAQRMPSNVDEAFKIAGTTAMPLVADYVNWYAATMDGPALEKSVTSLQLTKGDDLRRRLSGLWLAMSARANVPMPASWRQVSAGLYASDDVRVRRLAERIASVFGDNSMYPHLREDLSNTSAPMDARKHAFAVLSRARDESSLAVFIALLDEKDFRRQAIPLLARYDDARVSAALLAHMENSTPDERGAILNALCGRPSYALALLDAVAAGKVRRDQVTSFQIRALTNLKNEEVDRRVTATWGKIGGGAAEKQEFIGKMEKTFNEAPLWAYSADAGHEHFLKLCSTCHQIGSDGVRLGPELTGAGRNGIRYFLDNVIDPNAVIGADYQMTTIETKGGEQISGLLGSESASAVVLRTPSGEMVIAKADIAHRELSAKSLMPEGLIESLGDRERLELLKFLVEH